MSDSPDGVSGPGPVPATPRVRKVSNRVAGVVSTVLSLVLFLTGGIRRMDVLVAIIAWPVVFCMVYLACYLVLTTPPKVRRAAAWVAGVLSTVLSLGILMKGIGNETLGSNGLIAALVWPLGFGAIFLMVLFLLASMRAGIEWRERGGKPDPFTRT